MPMIAIVHLYANTKDNQALRAFEAKVLPILATHGGQLTAAFTPSPASDALDPLPDEIHIIQFPSEKAFLAYRDDPRHTPLAAERSCAIRKTTTILSASIVSYN